MDDVSVVPLVASRAVWTAVQSAVASAALWAAMTAFERVQKTGAKMAARMVVETVGRLAVSRVVGSVGSLAVWMAVHLAFSMVGQKAASWAGVTAAYLVAQ